MEELRFDFWGSVHYADYIKFHKSFPTEIIAFIIYPRDQQTRDLLGDSRVFTYHKEKGGRMTWQNTDEAETTKMLCEAISKALYKIENL